MYTSPIVSGRHRFLRVIHHPGSYNLSPFSLTETLEPPGEGVIQKAHVGRSALKSAVCTLSSCGLCVSSHPLQDEPSLMRFEQGATLDPSQVWWLWDS